MEDDEKKVRSLLPHLRLEQGRGPNDPILKTADDLCKVIVSSKLDPRDQLCAIILTLKAAGLMIEKAYGKEATNRLRSEAVVKAETFTIGGSLKDYHGPTIYDRDSNVIPFKKRDPNEGT